VSGGFMEGTEKQTDRLTYRQMNRQTDEWTNRLINRQMCEWQTDKPRRDRYAERLTYRKINRQIRSVTYEIDGSKAIKSKSNLIFSEKTLKLNFAKNKLLSFFTETNFT
jgi:hypothetical protein